MQKNKGKTLHIYVVSSIGNLSKANIDKSENVIRKRDFSVIISQLFKVIMLAKYVLRISELNDAQREYLKMSLSVSSIISQLFKVIILANVS